MKILVTDARFGQVQGVPNALAVKIIDHPAHLYTGGYAHRAVMSESALARAKTDVKSKMIEDAKALEPITGKTLMYWIWITEPDQDMTPPQMRFGIGIITMEGVESKEYCTVYRSKFGDQSIEPWVGLNIPGNLSTSEAVENIKTVLEIARFLAFELP